LLLPEQRTGEISQQGHAGDREMSGLSLLSPLP
jgi:hypothetical protein